VVYRLAADVKVFQAGMAQASASTKKLAGDLTGMDKAAVKQGQSLTKVGNIAGGIGLVAAAGLGAAVMKAADFDKAMSNVKAATGETAGNMDRLREAALQAGADTAFSASEAADAIKELSFAGISTEDILSGGLDGALALAAAGSLEVGDAASFAASAMNQFKLSGSDIPHVADLLAGAASSASGEVSDYGAALNQSGLVAAQFGLTIEETMGTLAAMGSAGFIGSDAGTSLKTFLQALVPASDKAQTAMEGMGFSAFDAQGNFVGMTDVAKQLSDGLGDMSEQQRNATLKTNFGADAVRAAGLIYEQDGKGMQTWIDKTDQTGIAAEQAATKMDNLAGDWEELTGSFETALIGTGEGAQGPLRSLVQGLTGVVNAYNGLSSTAQSAVGVMMGGAALLGGSIWVGTKLINGIASTRDTLSTLGVSAEKSTRAMRGLAKAGIALAGFEVAIAGLGALQNALDETLPGTEALTGRLLDLSGGQTADLGSEFDSLGDSIGRLTDENRLEHAGDSLLSLLTLGQMEGNRKNEARNEIEALDSALANLANTAGTDVASDALDELAQSQNLSSTSLARLKTLLPQYDEAMAGASNQAKTAALETQGLAGSSRKAAGAMGSLADMSAEEAKALAEAREKATETGRAFFGLGEKVNDAKVSLGGWLRSLAKQADALRAFRVNAQTAAKKGLDEGLIASLQEAGPEGALRMRQLANASKSEIGRANQVWRAGQREIDRYAGSVARVPKDTKLKISVDSNASSIAAETARILNNLDDEIVYIHTVRKGPGGQGQGYDGGADGMTVGGDRYPYGDKVLAHLAPGEEVISNRFGQADRHRGLLKAINANRYADGGTVHHAASASMPPLAGMRIDGSVSVNGLEGMLRGVVREEIDNAELLRAESGRAW
jgi:TP901 family phage tail tape measure protein